MDVIGSNAVLRDQMMGHDVKVWGERAGWTDRVGVELQDCCIEWIV